MNEHYHDFDIEFENQKIASTRLIVAALYCSGKLAMKVRWLADRISGRGAV